jgi:hypothetical protein
MGNRKAIDAVWLDGSRRQRLYLNGGGTILSFTGSRGRSGPTTISMPGAFLWSPACGRLLPPV